MNESWSALNATRLYPLDDTATGRDDTGVLLPMSAIADCHVVLPDDLAPEVWISGFTITDRLVAVVIVGDADEPMALASLTIPQPIEPFRTYWMKSLRDGVTAAVTFGDTTIRYAGRFTTYPQSKLLATCLTRYRAAGVQSIRKRGLLDRLRGDIELRGAGKLRTLASTVLVDGNRRPAIVFQLSDAQSREDTMQTFAGKCAKRPDSNTCDQPPVETVGGVYPDCDGNIDVELIGVDGKVLAVDEGIALVLSHKLDLETVCSRVNKRVVAEDACNPDPPIDFDFPSISVPGIDPGDEAPVCTGLNYSAPFGSGSGEDVEFWEVISGNFANDSGYYSDGIPPNYALSGSILHSCDTTGDKPINRTVTMQFTTSGPPVTGVNFYFPCSVGMLLGWRPFGELYAVSISVKFYANKFGVPIAPLFDIEVRKLLHLPPSQSQPGRLAFSGGVLATTYSQAEYIAKLQRAPANGSQLPEDAIGVADGGSAIRLTNTMRQMIVGGSVKTRMSMEMLLGSGTKKTMVLDLPSLDSAAPYSRFGVYNWQGRTHIERFDISETELT